jgi:hypothetical protein
MMMMMMMMMMMTLMMPAFCALLAGHRVWAGQGVGDTGLQGRSN